MSPRMLFPLMLGSLLLSAGTSTPAAAADLVLRGAFSGTQVVSATESAATGEVNAVLGDDDDLQIDLVYAGVAEGVEGVALHLGSANENGERVAELDADTDTVAGQLRGATVSLSATQAARVRAGESYLVITTLAYPDGAVRAQLDPQPAQLDDFAEPPVEPEEEGD